MQPDSGGGPEEGNMSMCDVAIGEDPRGRGDSKWAENQIACWSRPSPRKLNVVTHAI